MKSSQENKKTIVVVPDVHGRTFWRSVMNFPEDQEIIFLGDYMDPYPQEYIYYDEALSEFKSILEFKKANMDRVTLLMGNHMAHYVGISKDSARFDQVHARQIYDLMLENKDLFKHAYRWENTLFTHAGVTKSWLEYNEFNYGPDEIEDRLNEYMNFDPWFERVKWRMSGFSNGGFVCPMGDIGWSRGGDCPSGSPIWADFKEDLAYDPAYEGKLIQIVGHTQMQITGIAPRVKNTICCDSRACFVWDGETLRTLEGNDAVVDCPDV